MADITTFDLLANDWELADTKGGEGAMADWKWHYAKRFLPYVHSTGPNAMLIHKVAAVKLCFEASKTTIIAETNCGMSKILAHRYLSSRHTPAKMCEIPDPNAVLCGVCHGELPTFSKRRKEQIKKRWAKDHLGCKGIVEVIGSYIEGAD